MKHYESHITQFLKQLKQANPNIEKEQQFGRSLLWDREPQTLEHRKRESMSCVPRSSYEYYK